MKKILLILLFSSYIFADSSNYDNCVCNLGYWKNVSSTSSSSVKYVYGNGIGDETRHLITCIADSYRKLLTDKYTYVRDGDDNYYYLTIKNTVVEDNCVPEVVCDENQTIDTTVNPHACKDNPIPLACPSHSQPNKDNTFCECISPYVLTDINGTRSCQLPPSIPDDNSTNPDGSCKPGFAKNSLGLCKSDSDNDGVPDSEDDYPNDPSKSSDSDSDSRVCSLFVTECSPCQCPLGSLDYGANNTNSDGSFSMRVCSNGAVPIYCATKDKESDTTPDHDCNKGYIPAPDYAITGNCVPEQQKCPYPPFSFVTNLPFKSLVVDIFHCIDLAYRYGGGNYDNFNCDDGRVACYYKSVSDNNSTNLDDTNTDDSNDNNSSITPNDTNDTNPNDTNGTGIDTKELGNKLDAINKSLSVNGVINKSLEGISKIINKNGSSNHTDLTNINGSLGSLGSKLDGIKLAIDNKSTSPATDMSSTNQKLDDIEKRLDELDDIPEGIDSDEDFNSRASDSASKLTDGLMSYVESYTPIIAFNKPSGSCTDVSFTMPLGGTYKVEFAKHVDKFQLLAVILYFVSIFGAVIIVIMSP